MFAFVWRWAREMHGTEMLFNERANQTDWSSQLLRSACHNITSVYIHAGLSERMRHRRHFAWIYLPWSRVVRVIAREILLS